MEFAQKRLRILGHGFLKNYMNALVMWKVWQWSQIERLQLLTYEQVVYPLSELSDWEVPDDLIVVNPPVMEIRQSGRPKNTNRIPSQENQWTQHTEQQWQQQPDNQWAQQTKHQWQQHPDNQWTQQTEHQWQQEPHNQWAQETEYQPQEDSQNQWQGYTEYQWQQEPDNQWTQETLNLGTQATDNP
uniref:Uncharacterized protein n=1 Tax=Lactuca sativa TaxID=4236 RepID=A0A9R1US41_LACSA|nr:hypothetical protein LSAT_V11C800406190 [Lactuca sativa]